MILRVFLFCIDVLTIARFPYLTINVAQETYIASVFGETDFILECWPSEKEKNEKDDIAIKKMMEEHKKKEKEKDEKKVNVAETYFVVAILITTITFAVGITIPGGFE